MAKMSDLPFDTCNNNKFVDLMDTSRSRKDSPTLTGSSLVARHMTSTAVQTCVIDFPPLCGFLLATFVVAQRVGFRVVECSGGIGPNLHRLVWLHIVGHVGLKLATSECQQQASSKPCDYGGSILR